MTKEQKNLQHKINAHVLLEYGKLVDELQPQNLIGKEKRLRSSNAYVMETKHYYVLRSFKTVVAFIDKQTDTLYDVLRYVYHYTPSSAAHIRKFEDDYCKAMRGYHPSFRYY